MSLVSVRPAVAPSIPYLTSWWEIATVALLVQSQLHISIIFFRGDEHLFRPPVLKIFLSFPRPWLTGYSPVAPPPQVCSPHTSLSLLLPFRRWGGRWTGAGQGAHPANSGEARGQVQSQGGRDAAAVLRGRRGETSRSRFPRRFSFFFPFTQNLREPECDYWTAAPHIVAFKKNDDCTRRIESLSSSPEGSLSKAVFEVTSVDFLVYLNTVDSSKTLLGICSYLPSQ